MKKIFTGFIALFHFFYLYATPIATLSVADVLLIVFVILLSIYSLKNKKIKISRIGCLLCAFMLFHCLTLLILNNSINAYSILLPLGRILLYYLTVAIFCKEYFDAAYGLKIYKWAVVISTIFLFVQMIGLSFFGKYISGNLLGFPLLNRDLEQFNQSMLAGDIGHRPRSFFSEPSYYAIYALLYISIDLFVLKKHDIYTTILISIGLLCSGSGTGIIALVGIYVFYFAKRISKLNKKNMILSSIALLTFLFSFLFFTQTDTFHMFYDRTFVSGTSTDGRFSTYEKVFLEGDDSFPVKMFGHGIEKDTSEIGYMAGIPRLYYYYGFLGMFVIFIIYIYSFKKKDNLGKVVLALILILSFGTEMLFSYMILLYGSFLVSNSKQLNERQE